MEELKELVYILDRYVVRDINVITNPNKKKTKEESRYWEFYTGIQKDRWKTEEDAFKHFGYQTKGDKGFRRLKEGLKERLLNSALFIEVNVEGQTEYQRKRQEAAKLIALSELLNIAGAKESYFSVAEKALSLSLDIGNTPLIIQVVSNLRVYYSMHPKHNKNYLRVSKIFDNYWPSFKLETDIQTDYSALISMLNNKKGYKKEFLPIAESYYKKYEEYKSSCRTYMFQVYVRILEVYTHVLHHNWESGISSCDQAIEVLSSYKDKSNERINVFKTQKASCLLMLGRYDEALDILNKNINGIIEGKTTWFKNREIAAITSLYAEKYQQAWDLVQMATKHDRFNTISEVDQETWRLYEGYLQLICRINKEEYWSKDDSAASKFRLNRLLNEMPLYSQDKRGGNIPMLILQILFYVTELSENKKAFDEITNRVEALRKYNDRNLDPDEEHVRSDCFISLLTLLPKFIYKPLDLAKAAHPLLAKMKGYQTDIIDNSFEVEVVPYERQWEWIMRYVNELSEKK